MQKLSIKNNVIYALPSLMLSSYFVLSNFLQFGYMIESRHLINLAGICIFVPFFLYVLLKLILKESETSGFISLITIIYFFFTVPLHTSFREWTWYRNSIIFPLFFALVTIVYLILIRKSLQSKIRLSGNLYQYVVLLSMLLTGWELINNRLELKKKEFYFNASAVPQFKGSNIKPQSYPNILYVVFDMHGGTSTIRKQLNYNNQQLDTFLVHNGFRVWSKAYSATNFTPTTLASVFEMQPILKRSAGTTINIRSMYEGGYYAKHNPLTPFLKQQGYSLHNLGILPIAANSSGISHSENWGNPMKIITNQILPFYIFNIYRWAFTKITAGKVYTKSKRIYYEDIRTTKIVLDSLHKILTDRNKKTPDFVYAHFFIPHEPFKYDSLGKIIPWSKHMYFDGTLNQYYIDQIIYARKLMQKIVNESRKNPGRQWAIIFQGDHGIRDHENGRSPEDICHVLHSMYLPGKILKASVDTIPETTVNTFRYVLNNLFNQQIPLLPVKYTAYEYVFE